MNPEVDHYLQEGCGRCDLYATPNCKVHRWKPILERIRPILIECGLVEEVKWSVPCYTFNGKNILLMSAFKDYCFISFFKGVLLKDEKKFLRKQGKNVQAGRLLKFTSDDDLKKLLPYIKVYVHEAIEIERLGKTVQLKKTSDFSVPQELEDKFKSDPAFKLAFDVLTPGRQRGYILYFSGAKQSKTRASRIEKYKSKIMAGIGFHDYLK